MPLHRQLFLVLHDQITRGAIAAGQPLPTEQELCEQFGVSRITAGRALADLAGQGYIIGRQGVGSFVRKHNPAEGEQAANRSYHDEMHQIQFESEVDVFEFGLRTAPLNISDKIGLAGQALYVLAVRRERRTGEPLLVTEAWMPGPLAESITAEKMAQTPMFTLLAGAGVTFTRFQHEFTAEIAGPRNARLLDIAIVAVLRINRISLTECDQPHHITYCESSCHPTEAASCSVTPSRNWRPVLRWRYCTTCDRNGKVHNGTASALVGARCSQS